jgi:hypothetical protein
MRSSIDSEGFTLLNNWNRQGPEIRGSFVGIGKKLEFRGAGKLTEFDEDGLRFTGAGFEFVVDLTEAAFERVATNKSLKAMGLDPSKYLELAEIMLGTGDRVTFSSISGGSEEKVN